MKYQTRVHRSFAETVETVTDQLIRKKAGNAITEQDDYCINDVHIAIRLIERFSKGLGERVAVQLTFIQDGEDVIIHALITGYEGILFLHSPEGQNAYLKDLKEIIEGLE